MNVTVAESAGFCSGVRRTVSEAEKCLADRSLRVIAFGELLHNPVWNENFTARGGITVSDTKELEKLLTHENVPTVLIIRAHGIPPKTEESLYSLSEKYGFRIADMTCPFVKKIHEIVKRETRDGSPLFLLGKENHPESLGILGYAAGNSYLFSDCAELEKAVQNENPDVSHPILLAQTTVSREELKKCEIFFKKHFTNPIFFDTICNVTDKRQKEVAALADKVDVLLVIGGKNSSNTAKLFDIASKRVKTYFIEKLSDLSALPVFSPDTSIGITAGASTPEGLIKEIATAMETREMSFADMLDEFDDSVKTLHTGDVVTGFVTKVDSKTVYLDLGAKFTGVLPKEQITDDADAVLSDMFKIGDEIRVFVIHVDDNAGIASLSKKRVDRDAGWDKIVALKESGEIIEATVTEAVKGGVRLSYNGSKIFVPASLTDTKKGEDLSTLVGTKHRLIITKIDDHRKSAVGSIRTVAAAERKEARDAARAAALARIAVGDKITGTVKSMTTYGAFVDLGGIDGMVHNSELSWKRIKNPSEVVSVGQEITVTVKAIDAESGRISLAYKSEENDPWFLFKQAHTVGETVEAPVVSLLPFGAFVNLGDGMEGLIPVSMIALEKINLPADVLTVGQTVTARIVEFNEEKRRPTLSIKSLLLDAKKAADREAAEARAEERRLAKEAEEAERAEMAQYIVASI